MRRQAKWHNVDPVVLTQKQFRALRPSRNVIVVCMWLCLAVVSSVQALDGVAPGSVNDDLDRQVQVALAGTIIFVALSSLAAAFIRHSGLSLGIEIGAMVFGVGAFVLYGVIIVAANEKWWAVTTFAWAVSMTTGCTLRALQIMRRGY